MPKTFTWQDRDRSILLTLTHKVRLLTLEQIARTWWPDSLGGGENARKRMALLAKSGLIEKFYIQAHPELQLNAPVVAWRPGDPAPDFEAASYKLCSRWKDSVRDTAVFTASREAARMLGGLAGGSRGGGVRQPLQATHDLHVSGMFLRLLAHEPELAKRWISEETIAPTRKHQKLPDAMLLDSDGSPALVLEFGGSYRAERVERVHADCQKRSLPYELW